jgi:hypothetical protein
VYIGRCLAQDPKDLIHFGEACKKTNQIVKNEPFNKLVKLEKGYSSSKRRLLELRGPTGSDGLITQAVQRRRIANQISSEALNEARTRPSQRGRPAIWMSPEGNKAFEEYEKANSDLLRLKVELNRLAQFDDTGKIVGGAIYQTSRQIQSERELIRERTKNF